MKLLRYGSAMPNRGAVLAGPAGGSRIGRTSVRAVSFHNRFGADAVIASREIAANMAMSATARMAFSCQENQFLLPIYRI